MPREAGSRQVLDLLENRIGQEAFSYYQRLRGVRRFVLDHYAEPIALKDAARVAAMERTSFSAFFHRATGFCFRDWLAAVRVIKAMELMAASNLPVRDVGRLVGYPNVRTFERVFLRVTGRSPIEFKNSVRPTYLYSKYLSHSSQGPPPSD